MDPRLTSEEFWHDLRIVTMPYGIKGKGKCHDWCVDMLSVLERMSQKRYFRYMMSDKTKPLLEARGIGHAWLEADLENGIFVADGTAGQFFAHNRHDMGYYGMMLEAPRPIKEIYLAQMEIRLSNAR